MKAKNLSLAFLLSVLLSACGGVSGVKKHVQPQDPYDRLAEKLSSGGAVLAIRKVAVLPFSYTDGRTSSDGVIVSEKLLTRITNRGLLEVAERHLLKEVLTELKLENSGAVDEKSIKGIGKVLGVEAVVTGTLTRRRDGRIEVNSRLISTLTSAVAAAASETIIPDWETHGEQIKHSATLASSQRSKPAGRPFAPGSLPVSDRANCPRGMVAYWTFDAASGDTVYDVFGGNNGKTFGPYRAEDGKVGSAMDFAGHDYIEIKDRPALRLDKAFTVEAWIKYRSIDYSNSGSRIFSKWFAGYQFMIGGHDNHNSNLAAYIYRTGKEPWIRGNQPLTAGEWHHIAITYDGSAAVFYINGHMDKEIGTSGNIVTSEATAYIGWDPEAVTGYHSPIDGLLDELAVYGRALEPAEIAAHYDSGLAGSGYCSARN